ncbi:MAG: hypothetical protein U9Q38_04215, partial [Thermodesulfobacteriota bacterium]|nr:hypothetical protein [Thermodesulfobacteriota bacterium]
LNFHKMKIERQAVFFLLHFPSRYRDSTLWSTLPCGVRTFLWIKSSDRLACFNHIFNIHPLLTSDLCYCCQ